MIDTETLTQQAFALGFNRIGIVRPEPSPTLAAYQQWIAGGMHGEMGYMARPDRVLRRQNLNVILPNVQSLIVVALDYHTNVVSETILNDPSRGRIASYAWGVDYHEVMLPRLEALAVWIAEQTPHTHRNYVDTGAILERSHAQQAGLGFVGKNTMLIQPRRGSYFFLGEILTTAEADHYDDEADQTRLPATMCGSCTRCLTACPTAAFPRPHVLDARRCISYLTIEHKGWIARELRPLMGNWVFGCDVCQDVCPFQRFAPITAETQLQPIHTDRAAPLLLDLLKLDKNTFEERFKGSPIARIKRERLIRNACIAAGNWGHETVLPTLENLLDDENPLLRGHAVWAIRRIAADYPALRMLAARETNADVLAELEAVG